MNEPVVERPAASPAGSVNSMVGVITSPGAAFEEVARRPAWIPPLLVYLAAFLLVFSVYSMKADWVAIVTDQMENNPFMGMVPDSQRDQIVRGATAELKKMSPLQLTLNNLANYPPGMMLFFHVMAVIYSTLFVLMGSVPKLELGKAWVNLLVCLLLIVAYLGVYSVAQTAFQDAVDSRLMLTVLASVATTAAWIWLLNRRASADAEYRGILAVCTHASMVLLISLLALLALTLMTPAPITTPMEKMVKASPGALIKTGIPALQKLLEGFDLFYLWFFAMLTIGFRAVTRLSTGLTASIAFLPWAVVVLLMVAFAAVFG